MSGGRPTSEEAKKTGIVPWIQQKLGGHQETEKSSSAPAGNSNDSNMKAGPAPTPAANSYVDSSQKAGGNNQLWQNSQNGAPPQNTRAPQNGGASQKWEKTNKGAPTSGKDGQNNQIGSYVQSTPPANGTAPPQQGSKDVKNVQQGVPVNQPNNFQQGVAVNQPNNFQQGVPVNQPNNFQQGAPINQNNQQNAYVQGPEPVSGNKQPPANWQNPQGGQMTQRQGSKQESGDYVYYDGKGNQVQPPTETVDENGDRHFHHHYYYAQQQQQPQVQQRKSERPGKRAASMHLAAALITCWACTCCCHAPCGF